MNRRDLLKQAGLLGILGTIPGIPGPAQQLAASQPRVLRFAHVTDVHVEPELHAAEGLAACLHHLQQQADQPAFIMSGGGCVFDSRKADKTGVELQWKLWHDVWQAYSLPIEHCIGNHDIWAMGEHQDPLYGKKYALDKMRLDRSYRSFNRGGWHFI